MEGGWIPGCRGEGRPRVEMDGQSVMGLDGGRTQALSDWSP